MASIKALNDTLTVVRDVATALERGGKLSFPVPLIGDDAIVGEIKKRIIKKHGAYDIVINRRDYRNGQFHSCYFRYTNLAEINYSADLNVCWSRFAICKEVAHLLIDDETCHFTTDVTGLIQELITSAPTVHAKTPIGSETLGLMAALELLMPWKIRPVMFAMRDSGQTDREIAEFVRVPEKYVNIMLRSDYGKLSDQHNAALDRGHGS